MKEDSPADWMMLREGEDYPRLAWQEIFGGDIAGLYGADIVDFAYLSNLNRRHTDFQLDIRVL